MGKGLMVMIAGFVILFIYYSADRYETGVEIRGQTANYQYKTLAQEASKTGLALAQQAIADGKEAAVLTSDLPDGSYRTVLSKGGATYRIESQGRMTSTRSTPIIWTIYADYQRDPTATLTEAPPFLDYALLSQGDLELHGSPSADLAAFGDAENANIHTNSTLRVTGTRVRIQGFATYSGGASANPPSALETSFTPATNEYDRPSVYEVPQIEIPEFNVLDYADKVVPDMVSGAVTLSGEYNLAGTREDPFVWVVSGDLSASGGTTVNGYTIFMVDGNINLSGNVSAGMNAIGSSESTLAFYAGGNITVSGTDEIYGQFFADGDFIVQGTPTLYGTVTTRGSAVLNGTPNLNHVQASPALAQIWNDGDPHRFTLVAYYETLERTFADMTDLFGGGVVR